VRRLRQSNLGFSLAEVVVAAGLLASALAALAPLLALSIQSDLSSRLRTSAMVAAQQKLEELISAGADAGAAAPAAADDVLDLTGRIVADGVDGVFTRRWRVEPLPADPASALVIRVEVALRARIGLAPVTVRLTVIRRRYAP